MDKQTKSELVRLYAQLNEMRDLRAQIAIHDAIKALYARCQTPSIPARHGGNSLYAKL